MPEQRPLPPTDDLLALVQATLRNAAALLEDAKTLLGAESAARAHALATLALEEIGKSHLCLLALLPIPKPAIIYGTRSKNDFWAAWQGHTDKLEWALGFLHLLLEDSGPALQAFARVRTSAQAEHLRKLRGFYVDYDGSILEPTEITETDAHEIIAIADRSLSVASAAFLSDGAIERAREALVQHGRELTSFIEEASEAVQADIDTALVHVRETIGPALQGVALPGSGEPAGVSPPARPQPGQEPA
jgi:AbiV family abortive infection protein